jgi:WD40 repeat protein
MSWRDVQIIDGKLILVWLADKNIYIWDTEKGEALQTVDASSYDWPRDLKISGDGSKVFCLDSGTIRAWSIWTGEAASEVRLGGNIPWSSLTVNGSRVWVHLKDSPTHGWDFGIPGSPPIPLPTISLDKHHLNFIDGTKAWNTGPSRIEDTITGEEVFQLPGRFAKPLSAQWDGQYLVAGYTSGEVLIMDFNHMIPT